MPTIRKVTITGEGAFSTQYGNEEVRLTLPVTTRLQFSAEGNMADLLRYTSDVVRENLIENDSTVVTIRLDRQQMHLRNAPHPSTYADEDNWSSLDSNGKAKKAYR